LDQPDEIQVRGQNPKYGQGNGSESTAWVGYAATAEKEDVFGPA